MISNRSAFASEILDTSRLFVLCKYSINKTAFSCGKGQVYHILQDYLTIENNHGQYPPEVLLRKKQAE